MLSHRKKKKIACHTGRERGRNHPDLARINNSSVFPGKFRKCLRFLPPLGGPQEGALPREHRAWGKGIKFRRGSETLEHFRTAATVAFSGMQTTRMVSPSGPPTLVPVFLQQPSPSPGFRKIILQKKNKKKPSGEECSLSQIRLPGCEMGQEQNQNA